MTELSVHGGGAAKVCNRFEEEWTFICMLELVANRAESMRIETPGGCSMRPAPSNGEQCAELLAAWCETRYQGRGNVPTTGPRRR